MSILSQTPRYCIYALLIFTPLARASVQPWAITVIHMLTLVALTAFVLERIREGTWRWVRTPLDAPILGLLGLCLVSTAFSVLPGISFWSLMLLVNYLLLFYLVIHTTRNRSEFRNLCYVILGVGAFLAVFGLFKYVGANPFPWWQYPHQAESVRLSATFGNADHLAGYMEMALPLTLGVVLFGYSRSAASLLTFLSFLLLTALILSLSRGGWLGVTVGLGLMAGLLLLSRHFHRKRVVLAIVGGTMAVAFVVLSTTPVVERVLTLTERDADVNMAGRLLAWAGTRELIKDYPLLGTGPGTYATVFTQYQPPGRGARYYYAHNDYLQVIADIGLPVVVLIVWMGIAVYRKALRKLRNESRLVRGITLGALAGITAILVHSFGDFNLHIPANAILFTVLAALAVAPLPSHD